MTLTALFAALPRCASVVNIAAPEIQKNQQRSLLSPAVSTHIVDKPTVANEPRKLIAIRWMQSLGLSPIRLTLKTRSRNTNTAVKRLERLDPFERLSR
jgi:hypothetical protein